MDKCRVTIARRLINRGRCLWLGALFLAACSDGDASAPPVVLPPRRGVEGISVSPPSATVRVGDTLRFRATVSGSQARDTNIVWASSRPDVAAIDSVRGLAQALSVGSATLIATVRSNTNFRAGAQLVVVP
jgi:hypothetical protein